MKSKTGKTMEILETFVTKCDELPDAFKIIQENKIPEYFNQEFLTRLGFEKPNSILYVNLFKKLGLIDEEGCPVKKYYTAFIKNREAGIIIAQLVTDAYTPVFKSDENAHRLSQKKIRMLFREIIDSKKSTTIVNMVADTFTALTAYADWKNFEVKHKQQITEQEQKQEETVSTKNNNKVEEREPEEITPHEEFILELINDSEHDYENISIRETTHRMTSKREPFIDEQFAQNSILNNAENKNKNGENKDAFDVQTNRETKTKANAFPADHSVKSGKLNGFLTDHYTQALLKRAELLVRLKRLDEAVNAFDDIIIYSEKNEYAIGEENISSAFYNKAFMLEKLEKYEEALTTYDHFIKRYG